jgi:hypothetical protein
MHKVPSIFEEPCAELILWEDSAVTKTGAQECSPHINKFMVMNTTQAAWITNKILQFDD